MGLMIGIERERSKSREDNKAIWGARTFPLLALVGVLMAFLGNTPLSMLIGAFIGILILVSHVHWDENHKTWSVSATTAIAAILTLMLGYVAYTHNHIAIILAVILFGFLALKARLHNFAQTGITKEEMNAALTFLISAFVILPLLPNDFIDPWKLMHPTKIWFLFVVIAGVEFSSYIALKLLGAKWGVLLTGLLGGFASATATTLSLAMKSGRELKASLLLVGGIVLAEVSSLIIQMIILGIIAPKVYPDLVLFLALPAVIGAVCVAFIFIYKSKSESAQRVDISMANPISIKNTAKFALLISVGLILIALSTRIFGELGAYVTSALGGAVSLRVVTFSISELTNSGEILLSVASVSILIAMAVNMFVKLGIIYKVGNKTLCAQCAIIFVLMLSSGFALHFMDIGSFITPYLQYEMP